MTSILQKFEGAIEAITEPVKPYIPLLARFLLMVTFFEDSFRICTEWTGQMEFMVEDRGFSKFFSAIFLAANVVTMLVSASLAMARVHVPFAVCGLFGVLLSQYFGYGLYFNVSYILRCFSLSGGLLMLLAESLNANKPRRVVLSAMPPLFTSTFSMNKPTRDGNQAENSFIEEIRDTLGSLWHQLGLSSPEHVQLFGRVLLVFLFVGFLLGGELSVVRMLVSIVALIGCVMVVVGFRARWSAVVLIAALSLFNLFLNDWWKMHHEDPERDVQKFDFFQTLSVLGGFLLLLNLGPGGLSVDEKKKSI